MSDANRIDGQGSWTAFEAEALPHVPRLFRLAMWLERNRSEAEDLVQETLMQALQSFHRFQSGTNCRAWLVTILYHLRSNRRRARARLTFVPDEQHHIAETVPMVPSIPDGLTDEEVLEAIKGLPEAYQQIVLLCDIEELTYREAADALRIPIGTVMSRLHRARALLRRELSHMVGAVSVAAPTGTDRIQRG
jgi:RNA polymerase sigma-70 factor (ECF subfamily)